MTTTALPPIRMIPIDDIHWPKVPKGERDTDQETVKSIALSIQIEGMHHPILVKPTPDGPKPYEGVTGRHRKAACGDILKRTEIEARVLSDAQLHLTDMVRVSENLYRHPLNAAQKALAIKKWNDDYDRQRKMLAAFQQRQTAPAPPKAEADKPAETQAETPGVQVGPEDPAAPEVVAAETDAIVESAPEVPPVNFAAHVAERTNTSETTAKRSLAIGKAFTEEQLEVFSQMRTPQVWMETIAKLPQDQRNHAVNLIASGQDAPDAHAAASGQTVTTTASGQTVATGTEATADDELSDDAWVETHCGELLRMLTTPAQFKADAIFYRQTRPFRIAFREKVGKVQTKIGIGKGVKLGHQSYYAKLARMLTVAHPKYWIRCDGCVGKGVAKLAGGVTTECCRKCGGGGYLVQQEKK